MEWLHVVINFLALSHAAINVNSYQNKFPISRDCLHVNVIFSAYTEQLHKMVQFDIYVRLILFVRYFLKFHFIDILHEVMCGFFLNKI